MQIFQRRKDNDLNVRDNTRHAPRAAESPTKGTPNRHASDRPEDRRRDQERPIVYELEP